MNLTTLIQTAKGQYGLAREATEDGLFTDAVMKDAVNGAHKEFAAVARCYYGTITRDLTVDTVLHALDDAVIEPDIYTFRTRTGAAGAWTTLTFKQKRTLTKDHGAPESWVAGSPTHFFLNPGSSTGNAKQLGIYPAPNTTYINTGASNLKYDAWVYPPDLTLTTDSPVLSEHEHWRLIPWLCHRMALIELSRGRPGAGELVQGWYALALDVAEELREIYRRGMEEPPRTANVGSSAVEDATLRRMSLLRQRRGGGG
ncbi:MAG: hypothetical protein ACO1SX_04150 [Actinomycetota bacterium]